MKCLILAAGLGSRLRPVSQSKPLAPLKGTPLLEHVIRGVSAAGIDEFVVVTGHRGEQVEAFLATLPARLGVHVEPVQLSDWSRPNGFSVIAGADGIDGEYLLLMADHLFDPEIVPRLVRSGGGRGVRLVVDRDLANPMTDFDDATRVTTGPDGAILRIGKKLERYDAVDTGIFLATPALRTALLEAVALGRAGSLSDGVQRLADQARAMTMDIVGGWWIDVDDPRSHALAEAHLERRPPQIRDNAA